MDFVQNLEMTHIVRGERGSCYLCHYDMLHTLINMWLTSNQMGGGELNKKMQQGENYQDFLKWGEVVQGFPQN